MTKKEANINLCCWNCRYFDEESGNCLSGKPGSDLCPERTEEEKDARNLTINLYSLKSTLYELRRLFESERDYQLIKDILAEKEREQKNEK